jgi:carbon storage regulator
MWVSDMLIVTRKKNESILIGDSGIKITVIETGDGRVKLGIDAPKDVRIIRAEVAELSDYNKDATASRLPAEVFDKLLGGSKGV